MRQDGNQESENPFNRTGMNFSKKMRPGEGHEGRRRKEGEGYGELLGDDSGSDDLGGSDSGGAIEYNSDDSG